MSRDLYYKTPLVLDNPYMRPGSLLLLTSLATPTQWVWVYSHWILMKESQPGTPRPRSIWSGHTTDESWTMTHTVWFIHYGNVGNMTETQFLSHEMKYCLNLTNPICAWVPEWWYHFNRILEVILEFFGKKDPSDNLDLLQGPSWKGNDEWNYF